MAEMDNFSTINENFDTIKTLLNSIRAQGILNTSDVDKLLSGINSKLEKINTEEDIDLIKIFLSELKQNLDERHSVLLSKFGAIESLFSNVLKNSSELPKSAELKELFDIVATNLSVFSREVVSQKESLTDITLRLDAIRSDDSQKKDIIKNITILKSDLERLNNGFDSIVLSLNDNFKTIIKTITSIDQTEHLDNFASILNNIEMSSNTLLSAIQMLDKKTESVDISLQNLVSKDDISATNKRLVELAAQANDTASLLSDLSDKYYRIDNLADKIDASVNIIAGLKAVLEEADNKNTKSLLAELSSLESKLQFISNDPKFDEFKVSLESILNKVSENSVVLEKSLVLSVEEIQKLSVFIKGLDLDVNLQQLIEAISKSDVVIKEYIDENAQKLSSLYDINITRVLNELTSNTDNLVVKLNQAQSSMAILCEKNFGSVFENITDLKNILSQIDENSISANNAIFSNITDRLTLFENSLRQSLDVQEKSVSMSSAQLIEQIDAIRNVSNLLDYKMDSSVVEVGNIRREFDSLKSAIEGVLALDFVNVVKDLRVDLYASKQELSTSLDNVASDLSEQLTNDLYGKYELLISKMDSVEDDLKKNQAVSLNGMKLLLDNISSSIVDILSYVSENNSFDFSILDSKFSEINSYLNETNINYIENVRDIVNVIKVQVDENLKKLDEELNTGLDVIKKSISENSEDIKNELKYSYSKLLEIQDSYSDVKEILNLNSITANDKFDSVISSANAVRADFESKLSTLKSNLLDKVTEFKQELTCTGTENVSEIKFAIDNSYSKSTNEFRDLIDSLKENLASIASDEAENRIESITKINDNILTLKELINTTGSKSADLLSDKVDLILSDISNLKSIVDKVDENVDGDMTRQLSIIESNFESLVSQVSILFDKSNQSMSEKIVEEFSNISTQMDQVLAEKLESYKLSIEKTFDKLENKAIEQSSYIQDRIKDLNTALKDVWQEQAAENHKQLSDIVENLKSILEGTANQSVVDYNSLKDSMTEFVKNIDTTNYNLTQDLKAQLDDITKYIDSVLELQNQEAEQKNVELTQSLSELSSNIESEATAVKDLISDQLSYAKAAKADLMAITQMSANNNDLVTNLENILNDNFQDVSLKLNDLTDDTGVIKSVVDENNILLNDSKSNLISMSDVLNSNKALLNELKNSLDEKSSSFHALVAEISASELQTLSSYADNLSTLVKAESDNISAYKDLIVEFIKNELNLITQNVEKETDVIISEIIEQFDLLKNNQADDIVNLTSRIEEVVNAHLYNNIEDLKSYLDVKTDNSIIVSKLDNLKSDISSGLESLIADSNKLLQTDVFTSNISDFKVVNEIMINSAIDRLNARITDFVSENMVALADILKGNNKSIEDKLTLFDKKFVDTVVDKYEEIKLLSLKYNDSFTLIESHINNLTKEFDSLKDFVGDKLDLLSSELKTIIDNTNNDVKLLRESFDNLKTQISSKSFDEAFQASINKQISGLESLVNEQLGYIEEISALCVNNLPDVAELNVLVKHSVLESVNKFTDKIETLGLSLTEQLQNVSDSLGLTDAETLIESELKQFKSDIITQFLNIFNQVSFVAEQEEILDFIQDKHDELITVLSHIVTSSENVDVVKENVAVIDNKIDSLKDDLELINEKITAIISADGDIDYVYSLQDLESDIANLRIVLNEIKEKDDSKEFDSLINSTNDIYNLVESIKSELPTKSAWESISDDIVSISTRTNKLILASDESYKTLHDNLQDFKLVINDLDERTRNFAHESGMDKIDAKLNAINNMMLNGAKTNQVFNQVFEYLAEWVDNASVQINSISERVNTLDEIGQIKSMLADLKAENADNTETNELIEALSSIFDKQIKRISSLEKKLDKIIVETTLNNKLDLSPMEDTLNRFLVLMDEKFMSQQTRINSLEENLHGIMNMLNEKDTVALTKKVGGMDRQIAKLNKSIEKIASHVVEK